MQQNLAQTCFKRLKKEAANFDKDNLENIQLKVNPNNIRDWRARIAGPQGSYYEGYVFDLKIDIGESYPIFPPKISFITKIFHPNVYFETGEICLDILKKEWSPAWSIASACIAVSSLLAEPAADRYAISHDFLHLY